MKRILLILTIIISSSSMTVNVNAEMKTTENEVAVIVEELKKNDTTVERELEKCIVEYEGDIARFTNTEDIIKVTELKDGVENFLHKIFL